MKQGGKEKLDDFLFNSFFVHRSTFYRFKIIISEYKESMLSPFRDADFKTLGKGNFNCIEQGMFIPFTNLSSIINNKTFNLRQILPN